MNLKIGISSCLLGNKVRYDGTHKLDSYLKETFGKFIEFLSVCPEVECGLSIPREPLQLVKINDDVRLITINSKMDLTDKMNMWIDKKLKILEKLGLSGFIFKSRSPSCGLFRVKFYSSEGDVITTDSGIFAKAFIKHFPLMPVEEDEKLYIPENRENFIERAFVYKHIKKLKEEGLNLNSLLDFHTQNKLLILSHSNKHYIQLGRLLAQPKNTQDLYDIYFNILMKALKLKATKSKNANVLYHIIGYFKKNLSKEEKQELISSIESYRKGQIPIIIPITLVNHYVKKFNKTYLSKQTYLNRKGLELFLQNYV